MKRHAFLVLLLLAPSAVAQAPAPPTQTVPISGSISFKTIAGPVGPQGPKGDPGPPGRDGKDGQGNGAASRGFVNVLSFGTVKGDGTTDDGPAIAAIIKANPGRTVYFPQTAPAPMVMPEGYQAVSYYSTVSFDLPFGSSIRGDGIGTVIRWAPRVAGINCGVGGHSVSDLTLHGSEPWFGSTDYESAVIPAGRYPGVTEAAGASAADGIRLASGSCSVRNVNLAYWGRDGVNGDAGDLGLPPGVGAEDCQLDKVASANNRGHGINIAGGDSNCCLLNTPNVNLNQFWGLVFNPFLAGVVTAAQADQNHFDNARDAVTPVGAATLARKAGVVSLTFPAPYRIKDGTLGFVVGQGVTVQDCPDASFNATGVVLSVSADSTTITFAQTGPDAATSGNGRMARPTDTWAAAGLIGGAYLAPSVNGRVVWVNPYAEGGQRCRFANANIILNPVWSQDPDFGPDWQQRPYVFSSAGAQPNASQPTSLLSPYDGPVDSYDRVGLTKTFDRAHTVQEAPTGKTLWRLITGADHWLVRRGDPLQDATASDRIDVRTDGGTRIASERDQPVDVNLWGNGGSGGLRVGGGDGGAPWVSVLRDQLILPPIPDSAARPGSLYLGSEHGGRLCRKDADGVAHVVTETP